MHALQRNVIQLTTRDVLSSYILFHHNIIPEKLRKATLKWCGFQFSDYITVDCSTSEYGESAPQTYVRSRTNFK